MHQIEKQLGNIVLMHSGGHFQPWWRYIVLGCSCIDMGFVLLAKIVR